MDGERDTRAREKAEQRLVCQTDKQLRKRRRLRQRLHCGGHVHQPGEEDAEAHRDRADGVGIAEAEGHDQQYAEDGRERGQSRGLENIQKGIRARVQVEQTDDLARDRRANVRAEDDADGLVQCNDARTDESGRQDDRRRGALDDSRHAESQQEADDGTVCHLAHRFLQRAGRAVLQPIAHHAHTVEEQRQSAE